MLDRRPSLWPHLLPVWHGYLSLREGRQGGMGPQALSTSDVLAWLDLHGYGPSADRARWLRLFRAMEAAELTAPKPAEPAEGGGNRDRRRP